MRSPKEMRIIQIDITNACSLACSNCTRFCGNHKKPFFMDENTFRRAVDSLEGFKQTIGIMGGEPTLHPEFETFVRYLAEKHPPRYRLKPLRRPVRNFIAYLRDKNYFWDESINQREGPGLWTATGKKYYEHFELIQDSFSFQTINDHKNASLHQPMLVSRKDLGIPDDEWFPLRDKCWIQTMWSATVTPKGAFFCEIAGALDRLFDGPGGWPVEADWWKREPDDFGEQLRWCELCGAALSLQGRLSTDGRDDVSPTLLRLLEKVDSPKLRKGRIVLLDSDKVGDKNMPDTINRYIESYHERISTENHSLFPRHVRKYELESATAPIDLVDLLRNTGGDWVLMYIGQEPQSAFLSDIFHWVLNPGVVYLLGESVALFNVRAFALRGAAGCVDFSGFLNFWPEDKKAEIPEGIETETVNPDWSEWVEFARERGLDAGPTHTALEKIASDYGITLK